MKRMRTIFRIIGFCLLVGTPVANAGKRSAGELVDALMEARWDEKRMDNLISSWDGLGDETQLPALLSALDPDRRSTRACICMVMKEMPVSEEKKLLQISRQYDATDHPVVRAEFLHIMGGFAETQQGKLAFLELAVEALGDRAKVDTVRPEDPFPYRVCDYAHTLIYLNIRKMGREDELGDFGMTSHMHHLRYIDRDEKITIMGAWLERASPEVIRTDFRNRPVGSRRVIPATDSSGADNRESQSETSQEHLSGRDDDLPLSRWWIWVAAIILLPVSYWFIKHRS